MTLEQVRDVVVEQCEDGYLLVDEHSFSCISRDNVVEEGDGIYVARFRLDIVKRPLLAILERRIDKETGMHVQSFMCESVEYGIPFLNVALVISERTKNA